MCLVNSETVMNGTKDEQNGGMSDGTLNHAWIFEPKTANNGKSALTHSGVEYIAAHKYKPGAYTFLDNLLNPIWTYLTELLPMTLAPNMVTTFGGLHCFLAFAIVWYYSPNLDQPVPDWVVMLCGYCTIAYYTLDCMDGKQARRTGTSSPLGQLFDHGIDCICMIAHCSTINSFLMVGGTVHYLLFQNCLLFAFFMAQWEEYYTHVLPHATGQFGVTEVNYTLGTSAVVMSFFDRTAFWTRTMNEVFPSALVEASILPEIILGLELRYFYVFFLCGLTFILIVLSLQRVLSHENVVKNGKQLTAISKLLTPSLIAIAPLFFTNDIIASNTRLIGVSSSLIFSFLTKKMIVFSMAKMTFAMVQLEALPYLAMCAWISLDKSLTPMSVKYVLGVSCIYYAHRLLNWAQLAIKQICERLDIYCFTIKKKI